VNRNLSGHGEPKLNMCKNEKIIRNAFTLLQIENIEKEKKNQLEQDEGTIEGDENLKVYITEYYTKKIGTPAVAQSNFLCKKIHIKYTTNL
jgi:hypothetical protein